MWLIVRTDFRKEHFVARQIQQRGFDAWVPSQIIVTRPGMARRLMARSNSQAVKELPILPRRLFATCPDSLTVRHMAGVDRDEFMLPVLIPDDQIAAFRAEIDRENTAALALATQRTRKQKAKWRSLKDALLDMIDQAKEQLGAAA